MTKLLAGWPVSLTQMSAGFPSLCVESPTCVWVNDAVKVLHGLQIVSLFAVLFVDSEEYLCILVGFLQGARHAIVCILFSLEQSQVVD